MKRNALFLLGAVLFAAAACSDGGAPCAPCAPTGRTRIVEGILFVEIGPGSFHMGGQTYSDNAKPVHRVEFPRGYWIAKYEVTNEQYERFEPGHTRANTSPPQTARSPVVHVDWEEATAYCAWLAAKTGLPIRLPTEAEWEAACRAGSRSEYCFGDDEAKLAEYAWWRFNSGDRAHDVGTRMPNAWGLHDMHGNVWEWCQDTLHSYEGTPTDGSAWIEHETFESGPVYRIKRGGSAYHSGGNCESADRGSAYRLKGSYSTGFRSAMGPLDE